MALTKREMEDLRPTVDTVMQKTFGFSDPTVVVAALNCVAKGMDKTRTVGEYICDCEVYLRPWE